MTRIRVYMACSLDGYVADADHGVDWLERDHTAPGDLTPDPAVLDFHTFFGQVGAMLMGRATYDFVAGSGHWWYGETPVLVATRRALEPVAPTVQAVAGDIDELLARARAAAGERDVYLDGGDIVRQAIDAGLVDEMTLTLVPVLLGRGVRLFEQLEGSSDWQFTDHRTHPGGMVQVTLRRRPSAGAS